MIVQTETMPIQKRERRSWRHHLVVSCLAVGGLMTIGWIAFILWAALQVADAIIGAGAP